MGDKAVISLRLPNVLLERLKEMSDKTGSTMTAIARSVIVDGLEEFDYSQRYEPDDNKGGMNFVATDELRERASQAALMNGSSLNTLYIQLIS